MSQPLELVSESPIITSAVPPAYIPYAWEHVEPLLQPAVDRCNGRWNINDVLGALISGHYRLWVVFDKSTETYTAAMVTQTVSYPRYKMIAVQFLGGEGFEQWGDELLDLLERYAKESGCRGIESTARFGFWPFFKRRGYSKVCAVYEGIVGDKQA